MSDDEMRTFREYASAMMLNGQIMAEVAGLDPTDLYVMNILELAGEMTPSEIAERTALTSGAVTKLVDRLVRAGLVQRFPHPTDRRRIVLRMVDDAADNTFGGPEAALFAPIVARVTKLISTFPPQQREALFTYFQRAKTELKLAAEELQNASRRDASDRAESNDG